MSTSEISSLLARSAARHQAEDEAASLEKFFIQLGKEALEDYNNGKISWTMFRGLCGEYKAMLNKIKSGN